MKELCTLLKWKKFCCGLCCAFFVKVEMSFSRIFKVSFFLISGTLLAFVRRNDRSDFDKICLCLTITSRDNPIAQEVSILYHDYNVPHIESFDVLCGRCFSVPWFKFCVLYSANTCVVDVLMISDWCHPAVNLHIRHDIWLIIYTSIRHDIWLTSHSCKPTSFIIRLCWFEMFIL